MIQLRGVDGNGIGNVRRKRKKMLTLERRKALRSEKLEGDLGEIGLLESWNNLGLLFFFGVVEVLHWSFGLFGKEEVGVVVAVEVRHRRLGLETG